MNALPEGSRITFRHAKPNPLFSTWLQELYEEAVEKKSNFVSVLKEALTSLSKYPLPLQTGAECAILKGFDKKICAYLDKRLEVHNYNKNLLKNDTSGSETETYELDSESRESPRPSGNPGQSNNLQSSTQTDLSLENQENIDLQCDNLKNPEPSVAKVSNRKSKGRTVYRPAVRSGGYAILVALLENLNENPNNPALKKEDLIEKAQKHSEESFTRRKPDSFYTAWSNMTRLVTKGLVSKKKNKKVEYSLTEQGVLIAKQLLEESASIPTPNDIIFNNVNPRRDIPDIQIELDRPGTTAMRESPTPEISHVDVPVVEMPAGSFDVILLIDKCETSGYVQILIF